MATTVSNIALDLVSTSAQAPLGKVVEQYVANQGTEEWVYIQNASGAAWAVADVISGAASSTFTGALSPVASTPRRVRGIVVTAIPDASFGWIKKRGVVSIRNGTAAAIVALDGLMLDTTVPGRAAAAAIAGMAFGHAITAAATGALFTGFVSCE